LAAACAVVWCGIRLSAQEVRNQVQVTQETKHDESPALRDLSPIQEQGPQHQMRSPGRVGPSQSGPNLSDPVAQTFAPSVATPAVATSWEGIGNNVYGFTVNAAPPDTNGAVGPNHFVQIVNISLAVFSKTGTLLYGPAANNTVWSGFGGGCEFNNDGDPVVQYDKIADRWVIMQLSVTAPYPYEICVAVSTSPDPTSSYYRYAFGGWGSDFPDYPKLGVWPDGYYLSVNRFANATSFAGPGLCAFDRSKMLAGQPATQQCFNLGTQFGGDLPSDLDGKALPPAGSPNYFLEFTTTSSLSLFKFHVDWTTPANSTLTGPITIPVAAFSLACNGGTCIPQSGTSQQLDSLGDRIMYRLAYRNFGDHEALVANHSVTAGSSVGIRWYELRNPNGTPAVYQQGTYVPDSNYRWMGSIAMDQAGDIALGYSVSSSAIHPAIRYTSRVPTDPLGTLQAEVSVIEGTGSQTGGLNRWGDYSSMSVDPVDDCTFWYTTEYLPVNGSFNWHTRIASFKFPSCGGVPDFSLSTTPTSQTVTQGASTSYTVNITRSGGFTGSVTFSASGLPSGAGATFNPNPAAGNSSALSVTTSSTTPTGSYVLTIAGVSGSLSHTTTATLVVNAPPTPDFAISATPASQTVTQGQSTTYTTTVTPSGGFTGTVTFSASGLPTGATASFNPTSVTGSGSSTVSVATSSTTPTGSYAITITGTSGSLVHSTTVTLVVNAPAPAPDFSLSASPTSQTIPVGAKTTYTINITRTGGFTGSVTLSASGVPTGATASFSPNPTTGTSSTLTVATSSSTPAATYTITVTGTSGTLSHKTTVTLTVTTAPCNGECNN
jgi:hypothetical protein